MTNLRRCTSCNRELLGTEPEGLCPRCLLASVTRAPDRDFAPDDLPEDTSESYRPPVSCPVAPLAAGNDGGTPEHGTSDAHYRLESRLGIGGSGEVWSAVQLSLGRSVAVKRLHVHAEGEDPAQAARRLESFRREAVITGRLDHPNIVPVYDLGTGADGRPFLAMKLVDGTPWSDVLGNDASMPYDERLTKHLPILIEICRAVSFAHSRGVIHRDLKPSQVIIGQYGEVLLSDWGLAALFQRTDTGIALESEGLPNPAGTVAFMAPEQTLPDPDGLGPWTDVWLLGGILYYILTFTPPHTQQNVEEAFASAVEGEVEAPEARAPDLPIPSELSTVCVTAMAHDPSKRFESVEEFSGALSRYLSSTALRNESLSLASRASSLYATSADSYTGLLACDKLLQAAQEAWSANSEASTLRQTVLTHLVRLATSRGDLGMAEMQLQRIGNPAVASPLQAAIHKARQQQIRRAAQGRLLLWAIVVLAAAAVALAAYGWQATVRNVRIEAERLYTQQLAEKKIADEQQRAELLNSINVLHSEETSLSEELMRQLPYPSKLLYRDEAFGVTPEQRMALDEMISRSAPLAALRARLLKQGVPLEPEPFALVSARARLALHQSKTPQEALDASLLAMSAATARPSDHRGRTLLGIAAARAGFFSSATLHLRDAQVMASRQFTQLDPEMRELTALYEQARTSSSHILPAGSVVVESAAGTGDACREISGVWFDSTSRSCAPGVNASVPGRGCTLIGVSPAQPAVVRVTVPERAPRRACVYATWGPSANVARAVYTIHHANGVTSVSVCQAGFGPLEELPFRGNGNLWVPLGEYRFGSDGGNCIDISAHAGSGHPDPRNDQRLYVDAILFSPTPLAQGTTTRPLADGIGEVESMHIAMSSTPPAAGRLQEFLVETHPLGMNPACYRELSGAWSTAPPSLFAKSRAPGVTTSFKCGTRRIQTSSTVGQDAVARFALPLEEPARYAVYVTWARTANASLVTYRVRHADGITSIAVCQQGSSGGGWAYDRWLCLGTFSFACGADQGVDFVVPANLQPADTGAPALAYADAVLFSQSRPASTVPLDIATRIGPPKSDEGNALLNN